MLSYVYICLNGTSSLILCFFNANVNAYDLNREITYVVTTLRYYCSYQPNIGIHFTW